MLPMTNFTDRRFSVGSAVVTTSFGILFGFFFSFTLYLQFARGYSPLDAGLATLPSAATLVLVSPRRSPRRTAPTSTSAGSSYLPPSPTLPSSHSAPRTASQLSSAVHPALPFSIRPPPPSRTRSTS